MGCFPGQTIERRLGSLIVERAKIVGQFPKTLTARQKVKLFERVRKEPEHFLQSEGFRALEADRVLQEKMKHKLIKKAAKRWMKGRDRNAPCPCGSGEEI
jgi:hypothetical protein